MCKPIISSFLNSCLLPSCHDVLAVHTALWSLLIILPLLTPSSLVFILTSRIASFMQFSFLFDSLRPLSQSCRLRSSALAKRFRNTKRSKTRRTACLGYLSSCLSLLMSFPLSFSQTHADDKSVCRRWRVRGSLPRGWTLCIRIRLGLWAISMDSLDRMAKTALSMDGSRLFSMQSAGVRIATRSVCISSLRGTQSGRSLEIRGWTCHMESRLRLSVRLMNAGRNGTSGSRSWPRTSGSTLDGSKVGE